MRCVVRRAFARTALAAGALTRRGCGHENLVRRRLLHLVEDAAVGGDDQSAPGPRREPVFLFVPRAERYSSVRLSPLNHSAVIPIDRRKDFRLP